MSRLSQPKEKCLAVIRVRGRAKAPRTVSTSLKSLNLTRVNHATLVPESSSLGLLRKVKDYVTWGEISQDAILLLLRERAELKGGGRLTEKNVKEKTGYSSLEKLAEALYNTQIKLSKIPTLKPLFRLHPPKGGLRGLKTKPFLMGGETGYRGEMINDLVTRMV